jgi:hypothetical protein
MKYNPKIILAIIATVIIATACDIVNEPYLKTVSGGDSNAVDTNKPKILLEEFTGHKCINCPDGAKIAHQLAEQYPQLILVSIHCGDLAKPDASGSEFSYDFRTPTGNALENYYSSAAAGQPCGMFNRTQINNTYLLQANSWQNAIATYISKQTTREVEIAVNATYDSTTRTIIADVNAKYLTAQDTTNKLSVWILEDSIIAAQSSMTGTIKDYVHNNVLRHSFNSTWGDALNGATAAATTIEKAYTFALPATSDWKPQHLKVIAFIYNDNDGIKNVEQTKVIY